MNLPVLLYFIHKSLCSFYVLLYISTYTILYKNIVPGNECILDKMYWYLWRSTHSFKFVNNWVTCNYPAIVGLKTRHQISTNTTGYQALSQYSPMGRICIELHIIWVKYSVILWYCRWVIYHRLTLFHRLFFPLPFFYSYFLPLVYCFFQSSVAFFGRFLFHNSFFICFPFSLFLFSLLRWFSLTVSGVVREMVQAQHISLL